MMDRHEPLLLIQVNCQCRSILQRLSRVLVCLYRNLLLVFGGTGFPFGQHVSNDLFVLDLKRLHWKRCQILHEQPQRVYGAVSILVFP